MSKTKQMRKKFSPKFIFKNTMTPVGKNGVFFVDLITVVQYPKRPEKVWLVSGLIGGLVSFVIMSISHGIGFAIVFTNIAMFYYFLFSRISSGIIFTSLPIFCYFLFYFVEVVTKLM